MRGRRDAGTLGGAVHAGWSPFGVVALACVIVTSAVCRLTVSIHLSFPRQLVPRCWRSGGQGSWAWATRWPTVVIGPDTDLRRQSADGSACARPVAGGWRSHRAVGGRYPHLLPQGSVGCASAAGGRGGTLRGELLGREASGAPDDAGSSARTVGVDSDRQQNEGDS